jgi:hypothetical protein
LITSVASPPSPAASLDNTASDDEATQLTQFYAGHGSTPPRDNRAPDRREHVDVDTAASTVGTGPEIVRHVAHLRSEADFFSPPKSRCGNFFQPFPFGHPRYIRSL